jgi:hypothetical protein
MVRYDLGCGMASVIFGAMISDVRVGDVGDVRDPQSVGRAAERSRWTRSAGLSAASSGVVVRRVVPRTAPRRPSSRIRRCTVQRATGVPSRLSCRQTLRAP